MSYCSLLKTRRTPEVDVGSSIYIHIHHELIGKARLTRYRWNFVDMVTILFLLTLREVESSTSWDIYKVLIEWLDLRENPLPIFFSIGIKQKKPKIVLLPLKIH